MKLARLWDKDFQLMHTFEPAEDYSQLSVEHPAAGMFYGADAYFPLYLTVDDEAGTRSEYRLAEYSMLLADGVGKVLASEWREDLRGTHPQRYNLELREPVES